MRRTRRRAQLWLVERGYEERVVDPLDRADLAGGISRCDLHAVLVRDVLHLRRQAVRTVGPLNRSQSAVELGQARPARDWTPGVLGCVAEGSDGGGVVVLVRRQINQHRYD